MTDTDYPYTCDACYGGFKRVGRRMIRVEERPPTEEPMTAKRDDV